MSASDDNPGPQGQLALQTIAMPKDTNSNGDIFGGWLMSQMDLAGAISASQVAEGRVATVAINQMTFLVPVSIGAVVTCYTEVLSTGRSSMQIQVEVWIAYPRHTEQRKVTEGTFVYVSIDDEGRTRPIPQK